MKQHGFMYEIHTPQNKTKNLWQSLTRWLSRWAYTNLSMTSTLFPFSFFGFLSNRRQKFRPIILSWYIYTHFDCVHNFFFFLNVVQMLRYILHIHQDNKMKKCRKFFSSVPSSSSLSLKEKKNQKERKRKASSFYGIKWKCYDLIWCWHILWELRFDIAND